MNNKTITFRILMTASLVVVGLALNTTKADARSIAKPRQYSPAPYSAYNYANPISQNQYGYISVSTYNPLSYIPPSGSAVTYVPSDRDNNYSNYNNTESNSNYLDYGYVYPSTNTGSDYYNTNQYNYNNTNTYTPAPIAPVYNPYPTTQAQQTYNPIEYPTYPPNYNTDTSNNNEDYNTSTDTNTDTSSNNTASNQTSSGSGYSF